MKVDVYKRQVLLEAEAAGIPCLVSDTIPSTADMNLGLIKFISLNKDLSEWCEDCLLYTSVFFKKPLQS